MRLPAIILAVLLTVLVVGVGSLWAFTGPTESPPGGGGAISVDGSGNVGIGTATPGAKLDVNGQIKIQGGSPAAGKVLTSDAAGLATWQAPSAGGGGWVDDGVAVRLETSTDNVGIGTTNPGAKLEVAGQIKITGGNPGANKILTSDADGLATWQMASVLPFACPDASWTMVQAAGRKLGCVTNDEVGGAIRSWPDAVNYCFATYGGRLPTAQEWHIAVSYYVLNNEINGWEWVGDNTGNGTGDDGVLAVGNGSIYARRYSDMSSSGDQYGHRCWIPAQ